MSDIGSAVERGGGGRHRRLESYQSRHRADVVSVDPRSARRRVVLLLGSVGIVIGFLALAATDLSAPPATSFASAAGTPRSGELSPPAPSSEAPNLPTTTPTEAASVPNGPPPAPVVEPYAIVPSPAATAQASPNPIIGSSAPVTATTPTSSPTAPSGSPVSSAPAPSPSPTDPPATSPSPTEPPATSPPTATRAPRGPDSTAG